MHTHLERTGSRMTAFHHPAVLLFRNQSVPEQRLARRLVSDVLTRLGARAQLEIRPTGHSPAADYAGQVLAALEDRKPGAVRKPGRRLRSVPTA
jgi:hypothetical protein